MTKVDAGTFGDQPVAAGGGVYGSNCALTRGTFHAEGYTREEISTVSIARYHGNRDRGVGVDGAAPMEGPR